MQGLGAFEDGSAHDEPRGFNPWIMRVPLLASLGVALTVLTLIGFAAFVQIRYRDAVSPGVSSYSIDLSGMARDQVVAALDVQFAAQANIVYTFRDPADPARFWQLTAQELGVSLDAEATADAVMQVGSTGSLFSDLIERLLTWLNGREIAPLLVYDQNTAALRLLAIAGEINREVIDASFTMTGTTVEASAGQMGRALDLTATLSRLDAAILNLSGGEIQLVVNEMLPANTEVVTTADRARVALSNPITLVAENADGAPLGPWTASVDQIAAALTVDGGAEVRVNAEVWRAALESMAQGLIVPPRDARFHFNDETRQLEVIQPAVNGRRLNVDATLERMAEAVFQQNNRIVPLVFDYELPRYHDNITAAELGITEMISQGTSFYAGSTEARRTNIFAGAARFDGLIIAPGETFSFNAHVGEITPEEGYVGANIIYGGRTIEGVGGGVCQVSTTAFRAAFYAGFPIVERHAHGYRVGFYERNDPEGVGMDAAIYTPDLDLRFMNDLPHHVLIETSVFPGTSSLQFRFYSTSDGRQVAREDVSVQNVTAPLPTRYESNSELIPGQELQVDWAAEGAYVELWRVIRNAAGDVTSRERFASQYQPWGAIVQVPPNDSRLQG